MYYFESLSRKVLKFFCRKTERGYCVEHSVQVTAEEPSVGCYPHRQDFIVTKYDQCQCKPGYFASKAATSCESKFALVQSSLPRLMKKQGVKTLSPFPKK